MTQQPQPTVVEWGSDRTPRFPQLDRVWRHTPRALAVLGLAAVFGSFVSDWQLLHVDEDYLAEIHLYETIDDTLGMGLGYLSAWGAMWVSGIMLLVGATALALLSPPAVRAPARVAGLAGAIVMLGLVLAIGVDLSQRSVFTFETGILRATGAYDPLEPSLAAGWFLAAASVGLLAAALWTARAGTLDTDDPARPRNPHGADAGHRPGRGRSGADETVADGPHDLTVGPAEPMRHPPDRHELR